MSERDVFERVAEQLPLQDTHLIDALPEAAALLRSAFGPALEAMFELKRMSYPYRGESEGLRTALRMADDAGRHLKEWDGDPPRRTR